MPWLGTKRVAFVPVTRGLYDEYPIPPDWKGDIERRIYFDRDPVSGVDVSLRNFILTMSQGRADIVGDVLDMVTFVQKEVEPADLEPQLGQTVQGYDAGAWSCSGDRARGGTTGTGHGS
jgi:hypothetical protein